MDPNTHAQGDTTHGSQSTLLAPPIPANRAAPRSATATATLRYCRRCTLHFRRHCYCCFPSTAATRPSTFPHTHRRQAERGPVQDRHVRRRQLLVTLIRLDPEHALQPVAHVVLQLRRILDSVSTHTFMYMGTASWDHLLHSVPMHISIVVSLRSDVLMQAEQQTQRTRSGHSTPSPPMYCTDQGLRPPRQIPMTHLV